MFHRVAVKCVYPNSRLVTGAQICGHKCLTKTVRASAALKQLANSNSVHLTFSFHLYAQTTAVFAHFLTRLKVWCSYKQVCSSQEAVHASSMTFCSCLAKCMLGSYLMRCRRRRLLGVKPDTYVIGYSYKGGSSETQTQLHR